MNMTIPEAEILEGVPVPPPKPAARYVANAVQQPNGQFLAQWAAPGMIPAYSVDRSNRPVPFETAEQAEIVARYVLFEALNSRVRDTSKPERYRRLTGPKFAVLLSEANLTPTFFAFLYGTTQERVLQWMDGADGVPHPAAILLEIMKRFPQSVDLVEAVTERVTTQRKPPRAPR